MMDSKAKHDASSKTESLGRTLSQSSSRESLFHEPEFEKHRVLGLKFVPDMTEREKKIHLQFNRVLQDGFSVIYGRTLLDLIQDCDNSSKGRMWITDYVQPIPQAALILNIAAELVVHYAVSEKDLWAKSAEIYNQFILENDQFLQNVPEQVKAEIELETANIRERATKQCKMNCGDDMTKLPSFVTLEQLKVGKKITNAIVGTKVNQWIEKHITTFNLQQKPIHPIGSNADLSILGAVGSGKSSILNRMVTNEDKLNYISLATDDYRSIYLPSHKASEAIKTEQVFTRTQDTAYLIKELVQTRLENMSTARPNVIIDCCTLEGWHRRLLEPSIHNTQSIVACMNRLQDIPTRAYHRAMTSTNSTDAGRQINTASLIQGHAFESERLLASIPMGVKTLLYNTTTSSTKIIGYVDTTKTPTVCIYNIKSISDYIGKASANVEAKRQADLYKKSLPKVSSQRERHNFTYDAFSKATQLLHLPLPSQYTPAHVIQFADPQSRQTYLTLSTQKDSAGKQKYKIHITHGKEHAFLQQLEKNDVLQSMLVQAYCVNKQSDAREQLFVLGKENMLHKAKEYFGCSNDIRPTHRPR